ncbi:LOW QUALITY PROTEIN: cell adhesion molecule CEACAM8 [Dasypus novemcinctus]|uniref:LOW QUALITY PROTEIN: cell adhesion molecule CEACAM8 n=1 Tax=Dasypus novemcinctus TaxID=9361 RepID=UPI00265E4E2E|nr:LOW QUALITY PROTEIN: carcinoembryonic antigen-related cell adhesion molecule 8 [Dasypus novemcinctus]
MPSGPSAPRMRDLQAPPALATPGRPSACLGLSTLNQHPQVSRPHFKEVAVTTGLLRPSSKELKARDPPPPRARASDITAPEDAPETETHWPEVLEMEAQRMQQRPMEPLSGSPHRERTPWQRPLLTVSLLIFWSRPITAQLTIESVPAEAAEGSDVRLCVHNQPEDPRAYNWHKGDTVEKIHKILTYDTDTQQAIPGPAHSGRETMYPNGSLQLQKVTQRDSGIYTLQVTDRNFKVHRASGQIRVYPALPTPFIRSSTSDLVEGQGSVGLTCEPENHNSTYQWSMNNQSLPDSAGLQPSLDNRTLPVHSVTRKDTGPYECETRNPVSACRSDPFTLKVFYGPDAPTISPPGSSYPPGTNLSLSCLAASNPPTQYSWLIKGRPQQYTQELFILNVSVNDSGSYTCHVHNNVTGLNRTTVRISQSPMAHLEESPALSSLPGLSQAS